jgi:intein/homing endonuclease
VEGVMNKEQKFALFLGMLSGDGCLSIKYNGEGRRNYPIHFCNTDSKKVFLFNKLFLDCFKLNGRISSRKRENKKVLREFLKHSKPIVEKLRLIGFPEGVKRDALRVPKLIKNGTKREKLAFIYGFIITDGHVRKNGSILFHLGSKLFIEDLSILISGFIHKNKPIKEFIQLKKYHSYQLSLNKQEAKIIMPKMPMWDNGTPPALRLHWN